MSTPRRIQRRRVFGWRAPEGAVYVGRPTLYGNPYRVVCIGKAWVVCIDAAPGVTGRTLGTVADEREARQIAVDRFRAGLRTPGGCEQAEFFAQRLHGRDLMCWCPISMPCHADVLLALVNPEADR